MNTRAVPDPGGVILLGPPTAGKDTVSATLSEHDPRYTQLTKLKVGSGRTSGYRATSAAELAALRRMGRIVLETHRYGNTYAVDSADLARMRRDKLVPVVHLGSVDHLRTFREAVDRPWLCVLLWVPRTVCAQRSADRGDPDTEARLAAWDAALADLAAVPADEPIFHQVVRTDHDNADKAARKVAERYEKWDWKTAPPWSELSPQIAELAQLTSH